MTCAPQQHSIAPSREAQGIVSIGGFGGLRPVVLPRVRTFRNTLGDAAKWYRARSKKWWLTEPIRMGPQKLHIYGVLSRRTWRSGIRSIEVTAERVTILYQPNT